MKWIKNEKGTLLNLERFSTIYIWSQMNKYLVCAESDGSRDEDWDFYSKIIASFDSKEDAEVFVSKLSYYLDGVTIHEVQAGERFA